MKILLTTLNSKYVHTNLALRYLEAALTPLPEHLVCRKEYSINDVMERVLMDITEEEADVIAFSVYIWNVNLILALAENIKKVQPQVILILGGPEVTYRSQEILSQNSFVDYVCVGEGEEALPQLIQALASQREKNLLTALTGKAEVPLRSRDIPFITYRGPRGIHVGRMAVVKNMEKIPRIAKQMAEEYDGRILYFESSRGCPYHCSYCLSSTIRGVRAFPLERVKEELRILMDQRVKLVKFVDRTFNYDKKRAIAIWQWILEHNHGTQFHFELSAHLLDQETIEFLKTVPPHTFQFEIGVQSTNPKTLEAIHRTTNFEVLAERVKELKAMGTIPLHLDLIAGLPYEDYVRFQQSFNEVYALQPDELQLGFLKLLSGTQLREEEKNFHYVYTSQPPYEVLRNDFLLYDNIKRLKRVEMVLEWYYNSQRFTKSLPRLQAKFETAFAFYETLAQYFQEHGYLDQKIKAEELYDILAEFYQTQMAKQIARSLSHPSQDAEEWMDYTTWIQYLQYDYVSHFTTKRNWMPKYEAKWVKEQIDAKVAEMIPLHPGENVYKNYHFAIFEIDLETGEKKQNILAFRRQG